MWLSGQPDRGKLGGATRVAHWRGQVTIGVKHENIKGYSMQKDKDIMDFLHVLWGTSLRVRRCVLISALADICLRRYIEKTCQGHGELSLKIQLHNSNLWKLSENDINTISILKAQDSQKQYSKETIKLWKHIEHTDIKAGGFSKFSAPQCWRQVSSAVISSESQ